ncbi:MAG: ComEC/Rec2 family competence protein [Patescibacteria group bacterium]
MPSVLFFSISLFFIFGTFAGINKIFFIFLLVSLIFLQFRKNPRIFLKFILLAIFSFSAGYFYFILRTPQIDFLTLKNISAKKVITAEIVSEPKIYETYQKFTAKYNGVKIIISAPIFYQIKFGDITEIEIKLEKITDTKQNMQGFFLKGSAKKIKITGEHKTIFNQILKFKKNLESKLALQIPSTPFEIISGLLYGKDISSIELKSNFKNAGLSHLTAMSGYNLTIISSFVFNILKYFSISKFLINFISIPILVIFVIFAGAQGSIVRAFIMSVVLILIKNSGRIPLSRNILLGAALLITLINPISLSFDLGFQLSFLATVGIIYLAPQLEKFFTKFASLGNSKIIRIIQKTFSETLGAQIMVLPLIWHYFDELNILSVFSNLIILPLIPFFMLIGFIILLFIFIPVVPLILSYPFEWFAILINIFSHLPILYFNPPIAYIIFIYIYIFYLIYQFNKKNIPDFSMKIKT